MAAVFYDHISIFDLENPSSYTGNDFMNMIKTFVTLVTNCDLR